MKGDAFVSSSFPMMSSASTGTIKLGPIRMTPTWPLLPLAPAIVVLVGLLVAVAIGAVGMSQLASASTEHAQEKARLMVDAVGSRVALLSGPARLDAMKLAARRAGIELCLANDAGDIQLDASLGGISGPLVRAAITQGTGSATTRVGDTRFAVRALDAPPSRQYLVAFAAAPSTPEGAPALISALVALTTLLIGVAATVAYFVGRDANADVVFVTDRIRAMAGVLSEPTGEPVPVRAMDEVGILTDEINQLIGRFASAEKSYLTDLDRAGHADRDRAGFLAAVSHELRSPLNAILGFADVLETEVDGPLTPAAREEVEQIRGSGAHLLELINDILEFSAL
jgi:signal transduction histidine kinase